LANASSVGAKTVKGPGLFSVSTNPAALTAVTKVSNEPAPTAMSTMSGIYVSSVEKTFIKKIVKQLGFFIISLSVLAIEIFSICSIATSIFR
jgi:hypothetical protein